MVPSPAPAPQDGFTSIAAIKENARQSANLSRGYASITMLNSAKSQVEAGIRLQDNQGDLQGALLRYYTAVQ